MITTLKLNDWAYILDYIYKRIEIDREPYVISSQDISKKLDITFSHVLAVIIIFEKRGVIKRTKSGRQFHIFLTEKGKVLGFNLRTIINFIAREGEF